MSPQWATRVRQSAARMWGWGGHVTDLRCLINKCPHTFFYKCIIYNSAVLQQRIVAMWRLTVMKMNRGVFLFFPFLASSVVSAADVRLQPGLAPQSLQAFAYWCFCLMVWDSLVNRSHDKQPISAQSPDYVFLGFFCMGATHQHLTIRYFRLGGIARETPSI